MIPSPNLILLIVCLALIFVAFLMVVALETLEARADMIISQCPESGCIFLDTSYYSDYEYNSVEYWRSYCNSVADFPNSLDYLKCGYYN